MRRGRARRTRVIRVAIARPPTVMGITGQFIGEMAICNIAAGLMGTILPCCELVCLVTAASFGRDAVPY